MSTTSRSMTKRICRSEEKKIQGSAALTASGSWKNSRRSNGFRFNTSAANMGHLSIIQKNKGNFKNAAASVWLCFRSGNKRIRVGCTQQSLSNYKEITEAESKSIKQ